MTLEQLLIDEMETPIIIEQMPDYEALLYKRLSREHQRIYMTMRRNLDEYLLDFLAMNIRYFTSHGKQHSLGVVRQLSGLLLPGGEPVVELASTEILVLLCSAWLHDVGLLVNKDSAGRILNDAEIRKRHHELSHDKILEIHVAAGIHSPILADLIARVCLCHRRAVSIPEHLAQEQFIRGELTRPQLLAALLRMGDALDTDSQRAPAMLLEKLTDLPDLDRLHWRACQMIEIGYLPQRGAIHLDSVYRPPGQATTENDLTTDEARQLFLWKFADLCGEFAGVQELWQEHGLPYTRLTGTLDYPPGRVTVSSQEPLPEEALPLEIILYERNKRAHLAKDEFLFAADWEYQAARLYERRAEKKQGDAEAIRSHLERAHRHYKQAAKLVDRELKKQPQGRYFLRTLAKFYDLKGKAVIPHLTEDKLCSSERFFVEDIEHIQRGIDAIERKNIYTLVPEFRYSLQMGRSPLRETLRQTIEAVPLRNIGEDGSVHKGCSYCTARIVHDMTLANKSDMIAKCIKWLKTTSNRGWATLGKQNATLVYTGHVLDAFIEYYANKMRDATDVSKVVDYLIARWEHWGDKAENGYIESLAQILFILKVYFQRADVQEYEKYRDPLEEAVRSFVEEFERQRSYFDQLDAMKGLFIAQIVQDVELRNKLQHLIRTTYQKMSRDHLSFPDWGSNSYRTQNWVEAKAVYWEYVLEHDLFEEWSATWPR
jgi:hypothetical protein